MPFHPNPTQREIADFCGVARSTVGFILNGQGQRFSAAMNERVLKAATALGWQAPPDRHVTRRGRFGCAVLLQSHHAERSVLVPALLQELEQAMIDRDMRLTLARLTDEQLTSYGSLKLLLQQWSADGVFVHYTQCIPDSLLSQIERGRIAATWINSEIMNDNVVPDDEVAGYDAAMMLVARGHRRIMYLDLTRPEGTPDDELHKSVHARRRGYERAVQEAGVPINYRRFRHGGRQCEQACSWIEDPTEVSGVVAYGPDVLLPVLHATLAMGRPVPDALSMVTFSDQPMWALDHTISTFCLPYGDMAAIAADHLAGRIGGHGTSYLPPVQFVPASPDSVAEIGH